MQPDLTTILFHFSLLRSVSFYWCFMFVVQESMEMIDNPLHEAAKRGNIGFLNECIDNRVCHHLIDIFKFACCFKNMTLLEIIQHSCIDVGCRFCVQLYWYGQTQCLQITLLRIIPASSP